MSRYSFHGHDASAAAKFVDGVRRTLTEKALRDKPLWFFVNIVMPLLPKETKGTMESGDRVIEWRSLVTTGGRSEPCGPSIAGDAGDAGFLAGAAAGMLAATPAAVPGRVIDVEEAPVPAGACAADAETPPF